MTELNFLIFCLRKNLSVCYYENIAGALLFAHQNQPECVFVFNKDELHGREMKNIRSKNAFFFIFFLLKQHVFRKQCYA